MLRKFTIHFSQVSDVKKVYLHLLYIRDRDDKFTDILITNRS
jgi:hypothetical protein